jgi:hypothetical protein
MTPSEWNLVLTDLLPHIEEIELPDTFKTIAQEHARKAEEAAGRRRLRDVQRQLRNEIMAELSDLDRELNNRVFARNPARARDIIDRRRELRVALDTLTD